MEKKIIFTFLVFVVIAGIYIIFDDGKYQEINKNVASNSLITEYNNNITSNKVTNNKTEQEQVNSIEENVKWVQHNLAYSMLSEESEFKSWAKDVDLDPDDQGKSFIEIYEDRTGKSHFER